MAKRECLLLVLSVLCLLTISQSADKFPDSCPINSRVNLTGEIPDASGSVEEFGYVFTRELMWTEDNEVFGCFCHDKPCLQLCYHPNKIKKKTDSVLDDEAISATFPTIHSANITVGGIEVNDKNFQIIVRDPCKNEIGYPLRPEKFTTDLYQLLNNGSIRLPRRNPSKIHNFDKYCFTQFRNSADFRPKICIKKAPSRAEKKLRKQTLPYVEPPRQTANVGMIVSIPFLLVTFIVYSILPEMRNMHGLTLRGYTGCLLVAYVSLTVVQNISTLSDFPCILMAHVALFSWLASFFWLNVMCFDIWWTFGRSKSIPKCVKQGEPNRRIIYCTYAWGCAIFFTLICVIMNYSPGIPDSMLRPQFADKKKCWFKDSKAQALYFYGPIAATITCNIFFFVSTAVKLHRDSKDAARDLDGTDSQRHHENKQMFNVCLKLFVAMGVSWSMEIISSFCEQPGYGVWFITDLGNALMGLLIFIIFICNKKVIRLLIKRFGFQVPSFLSRSSTGSQNP